MIVGPTGAGKTRAAFEIARSVGGEVLVADSRQAYSGLHIATNHPPAEYRRAVRYSGLEFADPAAEVVNVSHFLKIAGEALDRAAARGLPMVVEGGSMLWIDALTSGFDLAGVPPDPAVRTLPLEVAAERVRALDPGARVDFRNPARVWRALEILQALGPPLAARRGRRQPRWAFLRAGLSAPMEVIERRLRARCLEQVQRGLLDETAAALARGVPRDHPVLTGIGYAEALARLEGRLSPDDLPVRMLQSNRRYARRQLAWFRRDAVTRWFPAEPDPVPGILSYLESAN